MWLLGRGTHQTLASSSPRFLQERATFSTAPNSRCPQARVTVAWSPPHDSPENSMEADLAQVSSVKHKGDQPQQPQRHATTPAPH
ncbi:hypothetical protein O3P69_003751 [Scylla paramamosain]|uniref:Uncharacterized protein n=1 Tax=Scylla paramamosain TaxID=85552 RepID=A0AAW0UGR4_SCYPA